jgi:hypothetical protein
MSEETDFADRTATLLSAALGIIRLSSCNLEGVCRRMEQGVAGVEEIRAAVMLLNVQYESLWHLTETMSDSQAALARRRRQSRVRLRTG